MELQKGNRVRIHRTQYEGYEGTIIDIDLNAINDENDPDFDEDAGEFYVIFDGWISGQWFWKSELIKI